MGPEQARLIQEAAAILVAHYAQDFLARDALFGAFGTTGREIAWRSPRAFTFLAHAAADVLAELTSQSVEEALRRIPAQDARLTPGTSTDWEAAINLVLAVQRNAEDIDEIAAAMDIETALTSTFSVATAVTEQVANAAGWSPLECAMVFSETIRTFFISYTGADRHWAEWIAWELENAGYSTILQAWDFTPGSHFVTLMHTATQTTHHTIAVLSNAYLRSAYAQQEWQAAWGEDPSGTHRKLLVFRVENCDRPGLLAQVVSEDLFGIGKEMARSRLLAAVQEGRRKPPLPPNFPGEEPPATEPPFPGVVPGNLDEAMAAGGPMTPDNPYAVAFAFWQAALDENHDDLNLLVTPESRGQWDLRQIGRTITDSAITTGVYKPRYDVAYAKLLADIGDGEEPLKVLRDPLPVDAHIISLVYRPELGGWRVHGLGHPIDPSNLPRS